MFLPPLLLSAVMRHLMCSACKTSLHISKNPPLSHCLFSIRNRDSVGGSLLRLLSVRIKELQFLVRSLNTVDYQMDLRCLT